MGQEILDGNIAASPYKNGRKRRAIIARTTVCADLI